MAPKPKAKVSSTRAAARSSKQATKSKKAKQPSPTPPSAEEDSGVEVGDEDTDSSEDEFLIVAKKLSEIVGPTLPFRPKFTGANTPIQTKKKNTAQRKQHEAALLKVAGTLEKEIQAAFNDVER